MDFNLIYISGLVLLLILILTFFGLSMWTLYKNNKKESKYEELLSKKNEEIATYQNDTFNMLNQLELNNERHEKERKEFMLLNNKLLIDVDFYTNQEKKAIMTIKERDSGIKRAEKNLKDVKNLKRK